MGVLGPWLANNCSAAAFPLPTLPGATVNYLNASSTTHGFRFIPGGLYSNNPSVISPGVTFCKVVVNYTPLDTDTKRPTTIQVWLPSEAKWNSRVQAVGGSGWSAGLSEFSDYSMSAAISQGYAVFGTDGGWPSNEPADYALLPSGDVDMKGLKHYFSTCLNDLSVLGKQVVQSYFGTKPKYSYFNGCSQGGRQGYEIAQKFPLAFDGIAASAPPVNWSYLMPGGMWAQTKMFNLGEWIDSCELSALTNQAIKHCDGNDGVIDELISDPDNCTFDPFTMVGKKLTCPGSPPVTISKNAAELMNADWYGWKDSNASFMHRPAIFEAPLVSSGVQVVNSIFKSLNVTLGLADTIRGTNGKLIGKPFKMVDDWVRLFLNKDPKYDTLSMSVDEFDRNFEHSVRQFKGVIGTDSIDLSGIRDAGVKLLSFHGLADPMVPARNTREYFERVYLQDPKVHDYYRLFEAPGVGHCYGIGGLYPAPLFQSLINWVEKGEAPDKLIIDTSTFGATKSRILCPHPQKARYKGNGAPNDQASGYECLLDEKLQLAKNWW